MSSPTLPQAPTRGPSFRTLAGLVTAACALTVALPASAYPNFPRVIQEKTVAACPPSCGQCHVNPNGGGATLEPPVPLQPIQGGGNMVDNIKVAASTVGVMLTSRSEVPDAELERAVDALKVTPCNVGVGPCDSDNDMASDWTELSLSQDPDTAGPGNIACPTYGCGARVAQAPLRERSLDGTAAIAALGIALVLGRRLRRR